MARTPPVLFARRHVCRNGQIDWYVWCPHCKREHIHGDPPGHRVAHCDVKNSPFMKGGYVFVPLPSVEGHDDAA